MKTEKGYREIVDKGEDVYPVEKFREMCKTHLFIDYDGFGHPVKGGKADPDIWVKPSRFHEIPSDATHVVWFNR